MARIRVNTSPAYEIIIQGGIFEESGAEIRSVLPRAVNALIVTDSNVAQIYLSKASESLNNAGFTVTELILKPGEKGKNLAAVEKIVERATADGLSRKDVIVALGGGVVGDLAGFAAAIYLRGIDFVQIPTSLLAQIDSSVGGKTGCDLGAGKNLLGAFHQPRLVLIDPETLSTLPRRYFSDGMAEAVKYGCIFDCEFLERVNAENPKDFLPELIESCVRMKRDIVERDEKENGERILLNFGHTVGHALEKYYNYKMMAHGEAVAAGMVIITRASEGAGLTQPGTADTISDILLKFNLPTADSAPVSGIVRAMLSDKKRDGDYVNLVLLRSIGEGFVYKIKTSELEDFLRG